MSRFVRGIEIFSQGSVLLIVLVLSSLLGFLLWYGIPSLGIELFFGDIQPLEAVIGLKPVWDGIWPAVIGTVELILLTACIIIIPGVGCGIFLAEYASTYQRFFIGSLVDILAGTPSIIMGLFGFTLILFLRNTIFPEANTGLFLASVCLALLVLPVLIMTTQEAFSSTSKRLRITAYALGFTHEQFLLFIHIPAALQGIWSGFVLALSRTAEDTAVILLTGVVVNIGLPSGLASKFEALPFVVYHTATQYQTQEELNKGFGSAIVLLILVVGLFILAQVLALAFYKLRKDSCVYR